jgi:hypothetical protein
MDETFDAHNHPALQKDDDGLISEIEAILIVRAGGDPYSEDGSFAATLASLPSGSRAMAATQWLELRLA